MDVVFIPMQVSTSYTLAVNMTLPATAAWARLQLLIESRYAAPVSQLSVDDNDNDNEREFIQRGVINKSRTR